MHTFLLGSAHSLTFATLPNQEWSENPIQIRGFAYQTDDGRWILSPDPQLKSCCVGSPHKVHQQIVLEDVFFASTPGQAITVQGNLYVSPANTTGVYTLANVQDITPSGAPGWTFCLIGVLALLWIAYKKNEQR